MPRVKAIYVGNGEYIAPTANYRTCTHPREQRRFYPNSLPTAVYCTACGWGPLHPFHGYSQEEIEAAKKRGRLTWLHINGYDESDEPVKSGVEWAKEDGIRVIRDNRQVLNGTCIVDAFSRPDWEAALATWEWEPLGKGEEG